MSRLHFNIPSAGKIAIDLDKITPHALCALQGGLIAALARSTEIEETKELEQALSSIDHAIISHDGGLL